MDNEEVVDVETTAVENEKQYIKCDSLTIDMFKKLTHYVDGVGTLCTYQTPQEAKSYFPDPKQLSPLVCMLIDYHNSKEKWRVKTDRGVKFSQKGDSFFIGDVEYVDFDLCLGIPAMNSVFIVPGEKTVEMGRVSPATVVRLTNMYSYRPVLLRLHEPTDDENLKISFDFMEARESDEQPTA